MAKIQDKAGWSYQITERDKLWAARMLVGEGGGTQDPPAVLWTMTQLLALRHGRSFTDLIRAYSQPINPRWLDDGQFCRPGGRNAGTEACSSTRIARRRRIQALSWEQIPAELRQVVERWAAGTLPNPVERAVEFADPAVTAGYVRRHPGSQYIAQLGNHFVATADSLRWPSNFVTIGPGLPWWGWVLAAAGVGGVGYVLYRRYA